MRTFPLFPALLLFLALGLPVPAAAVTLDPVAFGKGNDFTDPLDGVAEEVLTSLSTQDLGLNAVADASDPTVAEARGILEFDLGGLAPLGVTSATLQLPILDVVSAVGTIAIYSYAGDGILGIDDFAQTSSLAGTPAVTTPTTNLDVTAAVNAALLGGSIVGFLVTVTAEDQLLSILNAGESQFDSQLIFSVVPEPSHAVLWLIGTAVAATRRYSLGGGVPQVLRVRVTNVPPNSAAFADASR